MTGHGNTSPCGNAHQRLGTCSQFRVKSKADQSCDLTKKSAPLRSTLRSTLLVLRSGALPYFCRSTPERSGALRSTSEQKLFGRTKNSLKMPNNPLDIQNSCLNIPNNYLKMLNNYLDTLNNYLDISNNYLNIPNNYLNIPNNYLNIPTNYLDIVNNCLNIVW